MRKSRMPWASLMKRFQSIEAASAEASMEALEHKLAS